jgi:hypothetical protein
MHDEGDDREEQKQMNHCAGDMKEYESAEPADEQQNSESEKYESHESEPPPVYLIWPRMRPDDAVLTKGCIPEIILSPRRDGRVRDRFSLGWIRLLRQRLARRCGPESPSLF